MVYIGIDPGLDGGLAMLHGDGRIGLWIMPTLAAPNGKGRILDTPRLLQMLRTCWDESAIVPRIIIERQQAMPKQGGVSMFTIGQNYGLILGLLSGLGIPYEVVPARTWQKVMLAGVAKGNTKAASVQVAQRLFPSVSLLATSRCSRPHDGMADALLIAEYGRRTHGG